VTNIGNQFLDMGLEASVRAADPEAEVFTTSSFPRWYEHTQIEHGRGLFKSKKSEFFSQVYRIPSDFAVLAGMVITEGFISRYGEIIRKMRQNGTKIILSGAGPVRYNERETAACRKYWSEVGLYGLVSRDTTTFEMYGDIAEHSLNGIDSGFFLSEAYSPQRFESPSYDALAFDSIKEPVGLDDGSREVVRPHHKIYPSVIVKDSGALGKKNAFISEKATDYLNIYGNARQVHTDRVHACVASISYNVPCRLYSDSKRGFLFEKLGVTLDEMQAGLITIDRGVLAGVKETQIEFLRKLLVSS
jgi:hypothetical protein